MTVFWKNASIQLLNRIALPFWRIDSYKYPDDPGTVYPD